jgi:preprotein translocase subunit YajC
MRRNSMDLLSSAYAMGGQPAGGGAAQSGAAGFLGSPIIMIVLLLAIMYFLMIRPQQKRAKQHKSFMENLKRGDTVVTSGGLYGKITGITDDAITLEIAEKVRVKVTKSSIADYVKGEQA